MQIAPTLGKAEAVAFGRSPKSNRKQQGEKSKDEGKGFISPGNGPSLDDFLKPEVGTVEKKLEKVEEKLTDFNEAISHSVDGVQIQIFKNNAGGTGVVVRAENQYLAEAILETAGNLVKFAQGEQFDFSEKTQNAKTISFTKSMGNGRIGPFKLSQSSVISQQAISDDPSDSKSFESKIEIINHYKVEGKTGSLNAQFGIKTHDTSKRSLALKSISLQEDALSMVDFLGGLLKEGNNLYTPIICADKKGEQFSVYLIFNKENFDKEKAGSDE